MFGLKEFLLVLLIAGIPCGILIGLFFSLIKQELIRNKEMTQRLLDSLTAIVDNKAAQMSVSMERARNAEPLSADKLAEKKLEMQQRINAINTFDEVSQNGEITNAQLKVLYNNE